MWNSRWNLIIKGAWVNSAIREWVCIWFACLTYKHLKCPHSPSLIPPIPTPSPLPPSLWPATHGTPSSCHVCSGFSENCLLSLAKVNPQLNDDRANAEDWCLVCYTSAHTGSKDLLRSTSPFVSFPRSCVQTSVVALTVLPVILSVQHLFAKVVVALSREGETSGVI